MSGGQNGNCSKPELIIDFDNADMTTLPQTLNKETITPWGAASVCPDTQSKAVNTDCTDDGLGTAIHQQKDDLTTHTENLITIGSSEWSVPGVSSDWPVMSHDDCHDNSSSNERRELDSPWGETPSSQKLSENETDGTFVHSSNGTQPCVASVEGALDPFGQGNNGAFGSGFTDNFCEMSETDLIFRSGLVDEEFKTICVTAEEDDLWSSFTDLNNSTTANQSTDTGSWDPFPANQEPPRTEPDQEVDEVTNLDASLSKMEPQILENQPELTIDFTKEQVPSDEKCSTDQHSNTTTVFKMEETCPSLSANGNVHYDNPSNSVTASVQIPLVNLNMSQMLEDSAFREIILDESWMAEDDCLESKDVTVDLTVQSVSIEADQATEIQVKSTEHSSQAISNAQSKMDHSATQVSKLPGDINANVSASGQQHNVLIDFGDTDTSDTKMVVTPPPEFNNGFNSLMDHTSEMSNDLLMATNGTSVAIVKEIPGKGTKREPGPGDLERFLNELGEGTVVDENQTASERTPHDMDSFLDQLGDGTMVDEDLENGTECTENEPGTLEDDKGSTKIATNKRQTSSDFDRLFNELGDGTAIDEETENGHASSSADGLTNKPAVGSEEVLIRKRTPSDVDRFLNELGDGTVIDEDDDSLMSQDDGAENKAKEEGVKLDKISSQEEQLIQDTNRAWEQMVKEGSITMTENSLEESGNVNQLSIHGMDDINARGDADKIKLGKPGLGVERNEEKAVEEPKPSQASVKQDLNAKRRSFFGDDDMKNTTFQPVIPNKPVLSPSSISHSWALPTVPVLPKLQCSYQRPESFYETKPRAATDSLLSSHALLGLGGSQTVSTDTKSRSASEPPPSSAKTVTLMEKTSGSEKETDSNPKDPSIEAKSTQFIQALYGPKQGISSEIVEDEKTVFEYERERKDVLAAMKVKKKKRISWQGSHSDEMTSPDSKGPLSPSQSQNWKSQNLSDQESSGDLVTTELCKAAAHTSKNPPSVTREQTVSNRLEKQGPNLLDQKDTNVLETKPLAYDMKSPLKSPGETSGNAICIENSRKKAPLAQSLIPQESSEMSRTWPNPQGTKSTETQDDSSDGEAPIDLNKMRHLWEEKVTFSSIKVADQSSNQSQSSKVTPSEAKAREKQVVNREPSKQGSSDIPVQAPEVTSNNPMPRDPDDDYDHCDSFMYEITPHRRIPIQSHWSTESVIEQEIKRQTARERELLKEGLLKKQSDQVTVISEEKQVTLQRLKSIEKDTDCSESVVNREIGLNKDHKEMETQEQQRIRKTSGSRQSSIKTSSTKPIEQKVTQSLQPKPKVTPMKTAESEISRQNAQVVESSPPRPTQDPAPTVPVVQVETENSTLSKNDQAAKGDQPRRKESIVQREIRMQKERDEANARERRKAIEETKTRRASLDGSSRSSSGQSTPIKTPQSPTLPRASFTPIKASIVPKASENAHTAVKTPDRSPVVTFGLSSIQAEPYSSYREYQRMLRGRKTSEKTVEKPGPLRATEGSISSTHSPVVFKENSTKEPAPQRSPSPLFRRSSSPVSPRPPSPLSPRPPSPLSPRPPSPQPVYQGHTTPATVITEPVLSQDAPDAATDMKPETAIEREIRLATEREEELKKQRSASLSRATRKKSAELDVDINVVIVDKTQVVERSQVTESSQIGKESQSGSFSELDGVWRRGRETPVERDIRLAEERELKLRKEREETLSPVKRSQDSETLIEREIRLQQEREEQYRKEKGLKTLTGSIVVQGGGGGSSTGGGGGDMEDGGVKEEKVTAKSEAPKYRPQRRSLNLALQWEQMFK